MDGKEFFRRARASARARGIPFQRVSKRGKGGHQMVLYGDRKTTVKSGEIGAGLLRAMLKQLGIDPEEF